MVFYHLQENLVINMVKRLMDIVTKTGINAAKSASKRVVQKTAEATGYLMGHKVPDKITSVEKTKSKEKKKMKGQNNTYHQKKDCKLLMT